jgi:hypothetical protein
MHRFYVLSYLSLMAIANTAIAGNKMSVERQPLLHDVGQARTIVVAPVAEPAPAVTPASAPVPTPAPTIAAIRPSLPLPKKTCPRALACDFQHFASNYDLNIGICANEQPHNCPLYKTVTTRRELITGKAIELVKAGEFSAALLLDVWIVLPEGQGALVERRSCQNGAVVASFGPLEIVSKKEAFRRIQTLCRPLVVAAAVPNVVLPKRSLVYVMQFLHHNGHEESDAQIAARLNP